MLVRKSEIVDRIEPFIYDKLNGHEYSVEQCEAKDVLTHNRFDLAYKLCYLTLKNKLSDFAKEIYLHDIRSQTLGRFEEYGNKEKNSFEVYLEHFESTLKDLENNGFDAEKSLIPLDKKGTILNGAHRVASAIFLNKEVTCVKTELEQIKPDYQYFIERNVPESILDFGAVKFSEFSGNTYLAFLWPSGRQHYEITENLFDKVVYKKQISLKTQGGLNLLIELYKHMDWVGTRDNGFPGAHQKFLECFTDQLAFTVIMFQSESLERVQQIKRQVRDINGIGFSSVHITDTKEEAIRISKLIFNANGIHFLNYAKPYQFDGALSLIDSLKNSLVEPNRLDDIALSGSMTLGVYGLRKPQDIDYISNENFEFDTGFIIESHDNQLKYHDVDKSELTYNPKYYFEYLGVKFISFDQIYKFKRNRNEEKDKNDCQIMMSLIENNTLKYYIARLRQAVFYKKLLFKNFVRTSIVNILKTTNTYDLVRSVYRSVRKK